MIIGIIAAAVLIMLSGVGLIYYSSVYRPAQLLVLDPVHISPLDFGSPGVVVTTPVVTDAAATVVVRTLLRNTMMAVACPPVAMSKSLELPPRVMIMANVRLSDISKATRLLGYRPVVPLEDGLRRTCDWFLRR